jgi:hypothetical protein
MATQIIPDPQRRPMRAKKKNAPVLRLIDCAKNRAARHREQTTLVLEGLLAKARRGEVVGVVMTVKMSGGAEYELLVGSYEASPAEATNAAMRMTMTYCMVQDE